LTSLHLQTATEICLNNVQNNLKRLYLEWIPSHTGIFIHST